MIRLAAVLFALVLFVVPLLTAAMPAVAAAGLMGLLLAAVGIAGLWRWPVTAAACVFLTDYAAALWCRSVAQRRRRRGVRFSPPAAAIDRWAAA
jgi:hypothetical protein